MRRILMVSAALAGLGVVTGAVLGVAAVSIVGLLKGGLAGLAANASFFPAAALFGAVGGGPLAPLVGWSLLRRVPIGKAIVGTALGTTVGVVAGYAIGRALLQPGPAGPIAGALVGCISAAVILRASRGQSATRFHALDHRFPLP